MARPARPSPLVPPEVDLSGFRFMPLDTVRLLDSDLFAISTGDEFKAAVSLWCKSWLQKPAGSLPDDDRVLAHLSGTGARWRKLRAMAMRGFVLCSDGRWYHPLIAEKAVEAWQRREEWQEAQENKQTRQQRWRQRLKEVSARLRDLGIAVPSGATMETMERLLRDAEASTSPSTSPSHVDAGETGRTGTGTGTGTGNIKPKAHAPPVDNSTACDHVLALLRDAGIMVKRETRSMVDAWIEAGMRDEHLTDAIERAREAKAPPIPAAYLDPIVRQLMNPQPRRTNGNSGAWWASEKATVAKGAEFGLRARPGEEMPQFQERIRTAIAARSREA